jgi:lipoprotein-releasing system ATP-binding protein
MSEAPPAVPVLRLDSVVRRFEQGGRTLQVLDGASLSIAAGEVVAMVGPSGSGKSTLLHVAGLLERPDEGDVVVDGTSCGSLGDRGRTAVRRRVLGFVYQFHHLLPEFSALENVMMPQLVAGGDRSAARSHAEGLLGRVGLSDRLGHRPGQLSGGEQQRVAITRALANRPKLLLADEPTGNLDPETSEKVFDELMRLVREEGLAALIATHNPEIAARMDRRVTLRAGRVETIPAVT